MGKHLCQLQLILSQVGLVEMSHLPQANRGCFGQWLQLWEHALYICSVRVWFGGAWHVLVDVLRARHTHAGGVGVGIIRAPAQGEVLGTVTAGLGAVHTALQMLRSYLSLESHAKVPSSAIGYQHHSEGAWVPPASSSIQLGQAFVLSLC